MGVNTNAGVAIVTGAGGQDGFFLTKRLLNEGWTVHAIVRNFSPLLFEGLGESTANLHLHNIDLDQPERLFALITREQPAEFYNLAGQSSVSKSFSDPLYTWRTNAELVVHLLECFRKQSPQTRIYQASSTDMFGIAPTGVTIYNEESALNPQSPYASAKAAAHLLCHSYREVYGLRIASGILSNHESHRRPASFLSRKIVNHVTKLAQLTPTQLEQAPPLRMGHLRVKRDWGFAPDYVEGMCRVLRQIAVRATVRQEQPEADEGAQYRDYVLGTGHTHAVWELVDCAFKLVGLELEWHLEGNDPSSWRASFRGTGGPAVEVDASLLRVAEPMEIQ